MTDLSTLTDTELNERLAIAQGGPENHIDWYWWKITMPSWPEDVPALYCGPNFTTSLDALKSGPEQMLRAAGWFLVRINQDGPNGEWAVVWHHEKHGFIQVLAATEERARAEADCLALEAGK